MKSRGRRPQKLPFANQIEIAELAGIGILTLAERHRGIVQFGEGLAHELPETFGAERVASRASYFVVKL